MNTDVSTKQTCFKLGMSSEARELRAHLAGCPSDLGQSQDSCLQGLSCDRKLLLTAPALGRAPGPLGLVQMPGVCFHFSSHLSPFSDPGVSKHPSFTDFIFHIFQLTFNLLMWESEWFVSILYQGLEIGRSG